MLALGLSKKSHEARTVSLACTIRTVARAEQVRFVRYKSKGVDDGFLREICEIRVNLKEPFVRENQCSSVPSVGKNISTDN